MTGTDPIAVKAYRQPATTCWVRFTGTHEGEFMDIPPTGEEFKLVGTTKARVADGKLQEQHDVANMQALLAQLGVAEG